MHDLDDEVVVYFNVMSRRDMPQQKYKIILKWVSP